MQFATPQAARAALNNSLTDEAPSAVIRQLLAEHALQPFGISEPFTTAPLDLVPQGLLCRWWAFLHLAGMGPIQAAGSFDLGGSFLTDLIRMQGLYKNGPSQDQQQLKQRIAGGLPFDYGDAARTFTVVDQRFAAEEELFYSLLRSREAYTKQQLAITGPELLVEGVPRRRLAQVENALLKTVIRQPELNSYPTLAALAKELVHILK